MIHIHFVMVAGDEYSCVLEFLDSESDLFDGEEGYALVEFFECGICPVVSVDIVFVVGFVAFDVELQSCVYDGSVDPEFHCNPGGAGEEVRQGDVLIIHIPWCCLCRGG